MCRPENLIFAGRFDRGHIVDGIFHLRGDEPVPDQLVKPVLVLRQIALDQLRIERDIARADCFVSVLRVCLGLVAPGLTGVVFFAVAAADDFSRSGKGFFGNTKRVRSHIGDETHGAFFSQLDAFIELLGKHHRALRGQIQLSRRLLLQARGDKRRRGIFPALGLLDAADGKGFSRDLRENLIHILTTAEIIFLRVAVIARGKAAGLSHTVELRVDGPVFLRLEGADLIFAVDDHARRDRLHTTGGKTAPDLFPEQRA